MDLKRVGSSPRIGVVTQDILKLQAAVLHWLECEGRAGDMCGNIVSRKL